MLHYKMRGMQLSKLLVQLIPSHCHKFGGFSSVCTCRLMSFGTQASEPKKKIRPSKSIPLLKKCIRDGEFHKAHFHIKTLSQYPDFKFNIGLSVLILDVYIATNEVIPALTKLREIRKKFPHATILPSKVIKLATLLAEENIAEADELLATEALKNKEIEKDNNSDKASHYVNKLCHKLLAVPSARGDVAATEQLLNTLLAHNYTSATRPLLGHVIKAYIVRDDLEGAVGALRVAARDSKCLPCKNELLAVLIRKKNVERIERVMEISCDVIGHVNSSLDLAVCFLEQGNPNKAAHILQQVRAPIDEKRLSYLCSLYRKNSEAHLLRHLISVLKKADISGGHVVYRALLATLRDLNDNAGIKNVLEDMEADGYSLSDEDLNSFSSK